MSERLFFYSFLHFVFSGYFSVLIFFSTLIPGENFAIAEDSPSVSSPLKKNDLIKKESKENEENSAQNTTIEDPQSIPPHSPSRSKEDSEVSNEGQTTIEELPIEFYRPHLGFTERKNHTRVIISGKTSPHAEVWIEDQNIPFFTPEQKIKYLKLSEVLIGKYITTSDEQGLFSFDFEFPPQHIQLTIKISDPRTHNIHSFQINLAVQPHKVAVVNQNDLKISPLYAKHFAIWLGSGFNFLRYLQESNDLQSKLEFQTLKGPSFFGRLWWKVNDRLDTSVEVKSSPGSVDSSETVQISAGHYQWLIYAVEGTYYPAHWTHELFQSYSSRWGIRAGIQHHIVPFISRTGSSESEAEIVTNTLSMFTLGFQNNVDLNSHWAFEWFMRYQSPIKVGTVFRMLPNFGFDGSVGLIHALNEYWKLGVYWYGQWHDYSFIHKDRYLLNTGASNSNIFGHQSLFFSNIELRMGYEFN